MNDVNGMRITIVGAARSGVAAARMLSRAGARTFVTDRNPIDAGRQHALRQAGASFEAGGHSERALEADLVVISPGVPSDAPLILQAQHRGLPVFSEIEVAGWFCRAPIVAVTGTNGKTTTTALIGHVFRSAGRRVHVAGNIGVAFSEVASEALPTDVVVLEVSSFQLDHIDAFRPKVSVLLNITPDHLDRYGNRFENYAASKFRIFENQGAGDTLVYNADDTVVRSRVRGHAVPHGLRCLGISLDGDVEADAFLRGTQLVLRTLQEEEWTMEKNELALPGRHNAYNSLAAAVAARAMEVSPEAIRESLASFEGVPHRLEYVRELEGVHYINDSKATNVNAVWYALESMTRPTILIAGGRDKGNDYESLKALVRERVRMVIAIGESAETVLEALGKEAHEALKAGDMAEAIALAHQHARAGEAVLLSPACASFDMFANYEERGDEFRRRVLAL